VKKSGPYKVTSQLDGTLIVYPAWHQFLEWRPETGGGPGLFSRLALAAELQEWLNNVYSEVEAEDWVEKGASRQERRYQRYIRKLEAKKREKL